MKIVYTHDVPATVDINGRNMLLKRGAPAVDLPDMMAVKLINRGLAKLYTPPVEEETKPKHYRSKAEASDDE